MTSKVIYPCTREELSPDNTNPIQWSCMFTDTFEPLERDAVVAHHTGIARAYQDLIEMTTKSVKMNHLKQ